VNVAAGQKVKKGEVLLVMEAMKMANDVVAEADGTVQQVCVKEGQSVNQGDVLIQLQAEAAAAPKAAPAAPKAAPQPAPAAAPAQKPAAGASAVTAPLPGTVTKVLVAVGQQVKAGETVLTMEAMKMENNITAETAGTVKAILVQPGAQVQSGDALVELA
jgi:biotin carboxyl carrier protein